MMMGITSGKKAIETPNYSQKIAAASIAMRSSSGNTIFPVSQAEYLKVSVGFDGSVHSGPVVYSNSAFGTLLSASTEVFANEPPTVTEYEIDYPNWVQTTPTHVVDNRLVFGYKEIPTIGYNPISIDHPIDNHDAVGWMGDYRTNAGAVSVVGSSYSAYLTSATVEIDIPVTAIAGDWLVVALMHRTPVSAPESFITDYTRKVKGTNPNTPPEAKTHTLSILRRQLIPNDITQGSFVFTADGI